MSTKSDLWLVWYADPVLPGSGSYEKVEPEPVPVVRFRFGSKKVDFEFYQEKKLNFLLFVKVEV